MREFVTDLRRSNRLAMEASCNLWLNGDVDLDVHQATVVACLLIVLKNGKVQKQVRTFGTTKRELLSLREWLLGAPSLSRGYHLMYSTHIPSLCTCLEPPRRTLAPRNWSP